MRRGGRKTPQEHTPDSFLMFSHIIQINLTLVVHGRISRVHQVIAGEGEAAGPDGRVSVKPHNLFTRLAVPEASGVVSGASENSAGVA